MSQTEIDGPTNTSAARQLAELEAAFAEALSGYDEWQLARAWVPLVRLCATLPEYVGCIDASKVAKMIDVHVPHDEMSVEEAAQLVNRTPNRIR